MGDLKPLVWLAVGALGCGAGEAPRVEAALGPAATSRLERELDLVRRESAVEWRIGLTRPTDGRVPGNEDTSLRRQGRGLELRRDAGRLRFDVGTALEPVLPDALVGEWLDTHLHPLIVTGEVETALLLTSRMVHDRVRAANLEGALAPAGELLASSGFAGAGAHVGVATGQSQERVRSRPAEVRFRAAATPIAAHARYLDWLADGRFATELELFTHETRRFLAAWPMTPGYLRSIHDREADRHFVAHVRGDRALVVCANDPHVAPHFLVRSGTGWQMDLLTEAREVVNVIGGPRSWTLRPRSEFLVPFADLLIRDHGLIRVSGGDSRSSPTAAGS